MARIQVYHKPIRTSPGEHPVGPVLTLDTAISGWMRRDRIDTEIPGTYRP